MLLGYKKRFNSYEFYSPRGYLLDFNNKELLSFFTNELIKYIKSKNGYVLRIDPYIIYKQRDIDGNIVKGGIDNSKIVNSLLELGYKKVISSNREQVGWMFSLDLENKDEEQIFKEMKSNTRNIIRKTEKMGITIREISYNELEEFQKILDETSKRKGFSNKKIEYYQEMYKLFHEKNEVKFFIAELNLKEYVKKLKLEKCEKQNNLKKINNAKSNDSQKKELNDEIDSINKKEIDVQEIIKKYNRDIITLSGSMFILIQPEVIYLSSRNYEEFIKFNSQYLIQWNLIKYGIRNGFKKYNFYGIPDNINMHPKDYGIYQFKRGFNGYVEELVGEYELPINSKYYLFRLIHKLKK